MSFCCHSHLFGLIITAKRGFFRPQHLSFTYFALCIWRTELKKRVKWPHPAPTHKISFLFHWRHFNLWFIHSRYTTCHLCLDKGAIDLSQAEKQSLKKELSSSSRRWSTFTRCATGLPWWSLTTTPSRSTSGRILKDIRHASYRHSSKHGGRVVTILAPKCLCDT